jgi:hypothetical protein
MKRRNILICVHPRLSAVDFLFCLKWRSFWRFLLTATCRIDYVSVPTFTEATHAAESDPTPFRHTLNERGLSFD